MTDSKSGPQPFPLNRLVALLGPYVAILSGALATWLSRHFPGLNLETKGTAATISSAIIFVIGAAVTWALHHKWLDGWQKWEAVIAAVEPEATSKLKVSDESAGKQTGTDSPPGAAATLPGAVAASPVPLTLHSVTTTTVPATATATTAGAPATIVTGHLTDLAQMQAVVAHEAARHIATPMTPAAQNGVSHGRAEERLHPYPGFVLRDGVAGPEVRAWQQMMSALGWGIAIDGVYGAQSSAICRSLQERHGLPVDGEVGPETWHLTFASAR